MDLAANIFPTIDHLLALPHMQAPCFYTPLYRSVTHPRITLLAVSTPTATPRKYRVEASGTHDLEFFWGGERGQAGPRNQDAVGAQDLLCNDIVGDFLVTSAFKAAEQRLDMRLEFLFRCGDDVRCHGRR